VAVSGVFGWIMLCAVVLAIPDMDAAAAQGDQAFFWIVNKILPASVALALYAGIALAQYLCGLAAVTSTSRMVYAFARDGGLPWSAALRRISTAYQTPATAIWLVATLAVAFTVYTPVYATVTAVCTILLYISYVLPTALGALSYGRSWTRMGPWSLGGWYRPLAVIAVAGCALLIAIGMQPPYDRAVWVVGGMVVLMTAVWFGVERYRFQGPPAVSLDRSDPVAIADS
jgi:amino acid transporter